MDESGHGNRSRQRAVGISLDQLLQEAWERFHLHQRLLDRADLWQPPTDVFETPQHYIIQMELAGLDREDVEIEVRDRQLLICGQRQPEEGASGGTYHVLERSRGPFARSFQLPPDTDSDHIRAFMDKGLLVVRAAKRPERGEKRQIEVVRG